MFADSITFANHTLKLLMPDGVSYKGELSADGMQITGSWVKPERAYSLNFQRVTPTGKVSGEAAANGGTKLVAASDAPGAVGYPIHLRGTWQGDTKRRQHIVIGISVDSTGKIAAEFFRSIHGEEHSRLASVTLEGVDISISVPAIATEFKGSWNEHDGTIVGTWGKGADVIPLTLVQSKVGMGGDRNAIAGANAGLSAIWRATTHRGQKITLKIVETVDGKYLSLYSGSVDGLERSHAAYVTLTGQEVNVRIPDVDSSISAELSPSGCCLVGKLVRDKHEVPLKFVRDGVSSQDLGETDDNQALPTGIDPIFETVSLAPSKQLPPFPRPQIKADGRVLTIEGGSLQDLIAFAYGLHPSQIMSLPGWATAIRYDFRGTSVGPGHPNDEQWRSMVGKVLAQHCRLSFHYSQSKLPVYVLKKTGPVLIEEDSGQFRPAAATLGSTGLDARGVSMGYFVRFLQESLLNDPVVDKTALDGTFSFAVTWSGSADQIRQNLSTAPAGVDPTSELRPLTEALRAKTGLELVSDDILCATLVVDHIESPQYDSP